MKHLKYKYETSGKLETRWPRPHALWVRMAFIDESNKERETIEGYG
jgi:hypothetical protein